MEDLLGRARVGIGDTAGISEVLMIFRLVVRMTEEVVTYKICGKGKEGLVQWTQDRKEALEVK